jgi:hypothetical protein
MKTELLLLIFCEILFNGCAQKKSQTDYNSFIKNFKSDFQILRSSLDEGHQGLYRYNSKATIDSLFEAAESLIKEPINEREFQLLVCKVISKIGDGHTRVHAPEAEERKIMEASTAIPFQLYCYNDTLFVQKNFSNLSDQDFLGAQIVSINGRASKDLIKDFLAVLPSDGRNVTMKYKMISTPRTFTRFFQYLYGYTESYDVEYISSGMSLFKKNTIKGISNQELSRIMAERYTTNQSLVVFHLNDDKKSAYLKISSFDTGTLSEGGVDLPRFLQNSFKELAANKIKHLIIDLRMNGGGADEYGKLLFSYLIDHDFDYYASLTMKKETYDFFKYTSRPDQKAPSGMLRANRNGSFDNLWHPNVGKQKPSLPTFRGQLYVLINGGSFSTTSECLSMIHSYTNAVFIGVESGGGYYGNNSGGSAELILPATKIRIEIPLTQYTMAVKKYPYPDHGLIPTYEIKPTIKDQISGKDPELGFARKLIERK